MSVGKAEEVLNSAIGSTLEATVAQRDCRPGSTGDDSGADRAGEKDQGRENKHWMKTTTASDDTIYVWNESAKVTSPEEP